jgi:hypothetical protein
VPERVHDQLVRDDPDLLSRRGVEGNGLGFDLNRRRRTCGDAPEEHRAVDLTLGLREQAVYGGDRADAGRGFVERLSALAVGTREEQQVGCRLEVVLDAMVCLLRQRPLERGARNCTTTRSGLHADRACE